MASNFISKIPSLMPLLLCVVIGPYSASCPFGGAMQANFLFQKFAKPIHK